MYRIAIALNLILSVEFIVLSFMCQKFLKLHDIVGMFGGQEDPVFIAFISGLSLLGYLNFIISRIADYFSAMSGAACLNRISQFSQFMIWLSALLMETKIEFVSDQMNEIHNSIDIGELDSEQEVDYIKSYRKLATVTEVLFYSKIAILPVYYLILNLHVRKMRKEGTFYSASRQISETSYLQQIDEHIDRAEQDREISQRNSQRPQQINQIKSSIVIAPTTHSTNN